MSRDDPVGTASCYGLEGPGIGSRYGAWFSIFIKTDPDFPPRYRVLGVERPGRDINNIRSSRVGVKERVELYIYFHLSFVAGYRMKFVFTGKLIRRKLEKTA